MSVNPMDQTTAKQTCGNTTTQRYGTQKLRTGAMERRPKIEEHDTYEETAENLAWNQT